MDYVTGCRGVSTRIKASTLRGGKAHKLICSSVQSRSKVNSAPEIHADCHSFTSIFVGESLADTAFTAALMVVS